MNTEKPSVQKTILHIAPTPFFSDRGCHIRIAGIVRCLDKLGFKNQVCTYHSGKPVEDIVTHRIGNIRGYTKTSAGPSPYKLWADLKLLFLCIRQYRQLRPAAIHAHLHEGVLIGVLLKLLFFWHKTPLVADIQGSLTGELETYGVFKKYAFLKWPIMAIERALLLFATHIVCSSEHSVELIQTKFPESSHKTSLAQDGADQPPAISTEKLDKLRTTLGIDPDATCIVYSGALLESKGLDVLKSLIKLSGNSKQNVHFLIVGYPVNELESFLGENNLQHLCTLTGQLEFSALAEHLALGTIAIDPKNSDAGEGSGKLLNYIASGLAVVAFETINNRQFVGEQIRLANDIEEAHSILMTYVNEPGTAREVGQQLQVRFKSCYSWDICQAQLHGAYATLFPLHAG